MFVAINQMRYNSKKRKKAAKMQETPQDTGAALEGKEDNRTTSAAALNADEPALPRQLPKAPLLLAEVSSARASPPALEGPSIAVQEPAPFDLASKTTAESEADIETTCKCSHWHANRLAKEDNASHQPELCSTCSTKCLCPHRASTGDKGPVVITSLSTVYLCLGVLTLALASLSVLFYSHVTSAVAPCLNSNSSSSSTSVKFSSSSAPLEASVSQNSRRSASWPSGFEKYGDEFSSLDSTTSGFRERFQQELLASEQLLQSMMQKILRQQAVERSEGSQRTAWQVNTSATKSPATYDLDATAQRGSATSPMTRAKDVTLDAAAPAAVQNYNSISAGKEEEEEENSRLSPPNGHSHEVMASRQSAAAEDVRNLRKRVRRDISSAPSTSMHDPFIEFFAPNHRKVLEEEDKEIRKRTGLKGAAPGGDDWVYLNTYCRVPEKMITGFCQSTKEYCPPSPQGPEGPPGPKGPTGPPGLPGIPGPKGNRGDVGLPGPAGVDGSVGPGGPRGPKGDIGIPGRPGLDGRDGVPGEPGLDGVPGRAGADGIPGKDGTPGSNGKDGLNGKDGRDGAPGPKGSQGPPGERGLKGIAGPRGRVGKPGTDGTPGIPGVNAYKVQLKNGTFLNELLIPPSIADAGRPHIQRTVIVDEGKTLNLSCGATGNPVPHIEWRRNDGRTINLNGVEMSSVSGHYLKFKNISKTQMAVYTCYADNGLAPVANATYLVEVHFQPLIIYYNTVVYAQYGGTATLECEVQAFPEPIRYWERASDGQMLDPGDKYRIESYMESFSTRMLLTITNLRNDDFGYYYCTARNALNVTSISFEVAPYNPNSETPFVKKERKVTGQMPVEQECPVCEECPDPSLNQCKDSVNSNFEIQLTGNYNNRDQPERKKKCLLYAVGKPVFHKSVDRSYGAWLRDPAARDADREKTYTTSEASNSVLYEYTMKRAFRQADMPRKQYTITEGFHGNAHVVFNGSFYYNPANSSRVAKFNLATFEKITQELPGASGVGTKLYATDYNYMDFNVDEIGLWVIYSTNESNNTLVAKLNETTLDIQYSYNITLNHRNFGEMFIVCGHLYAIDSCTEKNSQIRYAVDLYGLKLLNVNLPFTNPFTRTTTVGYNPQTVELYSFDKGNSLTYPIRYTEEAAKKEYA